MKPSVERRRKKILAWAENQRDDVLTFYDMYRRTVPIDLDDLVPNHNDLSLNELTKTFLDLSQTHTSVNTDKITETFYGRMRSAFDIWRHIKKYRPDVALFEVMNSFYEIRDSLYGHYCFVVKRSVFTTERTTWRETIGFPVKNFRCTELNILFNSWGKLGVNDVE